MRFIHYAFTVLGCAVWWRFCAAVDDTERLLEKEKNSTSPGVRYRLTFDALTRTTKVFISAFIPELSKLSIPFKIQNLTVDKESLAIRSIRLVNINEPRDVSIEPYQPNAMLVKIKNFALSMECDLNGVMNDKLLDGRLHLHSNRTSVNLLIRIRKHPTALAPIIDLRECHTYTDNNYTNNNSSNRLKLTTEFMPSNSNSVVEQVISQNAENFFDSVLCTYIDWIINRKINNRFARTSTSVSLAKLAQIDPKHSALAALSRRYHKAHHRKGRPRRSPEVLASVLDTFNLSRAASLHLEYGLVDDPIVNEFGLELNCSGEVSENGKGATPFGAAPMQLLSMQNSTPMLQIVVSDYVTNSLMYHGHKIGLFNTRVDPSSPQIGPVLRTTCGLGSGPLFCLGDILPTLRQYHPNKSIAMDFRSVQQPILIYRSSPEGSFLGMNGRITVWTMKGRKTEEKIGDVEIEIEALVKFRVSGHTLRTKLSLEKVQFTSSNSKALQQEELDDAGLLGREIMQKIVNDVLKDGVPIPIHPIFKLYNTKVAVMDRYCALMCDFRVNHKTVRQFINHQSSSLFW